MNSYRSLHAVAEGESREPLADRMVRESRDWVLATELCEETGASYRQVDYWTRSGLLTPKPLTGVGAGNPRRYDRNQLDRCHAVVALLNAGIDLAAVRDHIDHLIRHGGYQAGPVTVTYTPDQEHHE